MSGVVFLIGPPNSGKSTIAHAFAEETGAFGISGGEIARELARTNDEVSEALSFGEIAPKGIMDPVMLSEVIGAAMGNPMVVVDGYPRYLEQLIDVVKFVPGDHYFFLVTAPSADLAARAEDRMRSDDPIHDRRCREYVEHAAPMITWLLHRWVLIEVINTAPYDVDFGVRMMIDHINLARGFPKGIELVMV